MKKRTMALFLAGAFAFVTAGSVIAAEKDVNKDAIARLEALKGAFLAGVRAEAIEANAAIPSRIATGPATGWMKKVPSNQVNMVTNKFEKKPQTEVVMDGRTYFTSGEGYINTLRANPSLRFAKDPLTNKQIDKAAAVIFADAQGKVLYFASEESFRNFVALATPQTVYGYSEAK